MRLPNPSNKKAHFINGLFIMLKIQDRVRIESTDKITNCSTKVGTFSSKFSLLKVSKENPIIEGIKTKNNLINRRLPPPLGTSPPPLPA